MKKLIALFCFLPTFIQAQNSLLFEISKKGVKQKSYLFGTIHMQDEQAYAFNDSVFWAIDQCKNAAFELDFTQIKIKEYTELLNNIRKDEFKDNASNYLIEEFVPKLMANFTAEELANMITQKIFPTYMDFVANKFKGEKRQFIIDQYLQAYAFQKNKEVIGIETYEEQLNAILGDIYKMDFAAIGDYIITNLKDENLNFNLIKSLSGTEEMASFYSQFQLDNLCNYINSYESSTSTIGSTMYKRIFYDRNTTMFERTKEAVKKEGIFIAVGAGHLCGSSGLIAQYEKEGYTVRPINIATPYRRSIEWEEFKLENYSVDLPVGAAINEKTSYYDYATFDYQSQSFLSNGAVKFSINWYYTAEDEPEVMEYVDVYNNEVEYDESNEIVYEESYLEIEGMEIDGPAETAEESIYIYPDEDIEMIDIEVPYNYLESQDAIVEETVEEYYEDIAIEPYDEVEVEDNVYNREEPLNENDDYSVDYDDYESSDNVYKSPYAKFKERFTEEQWEYISEVGDSIKAHMKEMQSPTALALDNMKEQKSTREIDANGVKYELSYNSRYGKNTLTYELKHKDILYALEAQGDPEALKSKEIERFFTSFKVLE